MFDRSTRYLRAAVVLAAVSVLTPAVTKAADQPLISAAGQRADVGLTCDDGNSYRLRARAVSADGDLVTGYLLYGPRGNQYLRLIPAGYGYRYAGVGVWLDGRRTAATLNFGLDRSTGCDVVVAP